ncbi:PREDICTED: coiled-coil domain-containing glutamate-rich protein 1-like, partial [Galeopterus variegatus]|uniref:Coiled-coil domain-containing glutamate-rich protein 1-like n=1 Tax=Galeopterus variegatus TaxID=482537 RepID=A0ABM0RAJ6_GALVR
MRAASSCKRSTGLCPAQRTTTDQIQRAISTPPRSQALAGWAVGSPRTPRRGSGAGRNDAKRSDARTQRDAVTHAPLRAASGPLAPSLPPPRPPRRHQPPTANRCTRGGAAALGAGARPASGHHPEPEREPGPQRPRPLPVSASVRQAPARRAMDSDEGYNYEFDEDEECSEEDSGAEEEEDEDEDEPDDDNLDLGEVELVEPGLGVGESESRGLS